MTTWLELALRCEKAAGPDIGIDCDIMRAVLPNDDEDKEASDYELLQPMYHRKYTDSINAITALVKREFPDRGWTLGKPEGGGYGLASIWDHTNRRRPVVRSQSGTPELALCAAFCRAMAEKEMK